MATSTSSISGLVSGMDTSSIVTQLMQIEAQPQNLLKTQLSGVQTDAAAYRDVNSSFAALASAAQSVTQATTWRAVKATSSSSGVVATAGTGAQAGSVTFTVDSLAGNHSVVSDKTQKWASTSTAFGLGTLTLTRTSDNSKVTVTPTDVDGNGTITLAEAVAAINAQATGYTAAPVNTGSGYQLQLTSTATGASSRFTLSSSAGSTTFGVLNQGTDAQITMGSGGANPVTVTSPTNTFSEVLPGTTFTVSQTTATGAAPTTVSVASNPDAVATAIATMVNAANAALTKIAQYTDSSTGSTAPLKGDWSLISLSGQILDAVSSAVGGLSGLSGSSVLGNSSAGINGLQLTKDGTLSFDASAFKTALAANPKLVQAVFTGVTGVGADGVANTPDDTLVTDGIGARLQRLADAASDSVSGSLTAMATGQDSRAKDLQSQIDAWDLRLQARQQTLTDQFKAMETALSTLKNQSTWLTQQLAALPNTSSSNS